MALIHEFLSPQRRGVVTLPSSLRERLQLDVPGAQLEVIEHVDGTFELRSTVAVRAAQSWFWTDRWQRMEHQAEADIAAGRTASFETVDEFLSDLDS